MVGVIDGFRWAILGESTLWLPGFLVSWVLIAFFLWLGIPPVPPDGKELRGPDLSPLMSDIAISVDGLSKRYFIGHNVAQAGSYT